MGETMLGQLGSHRVIPLLKILLSLTAAPILGALDTGFRAYVMLQLLAASADDGSQMVATLRLAAELSVGSALTTAFVRAGASARVRIRCLGILGFALALVVRHRSLGFVLERLRTLDHGACILLSQTLKLAPTRHAKHGRTCDAADIWRYAESGLPIRVAAWLVVATTLSH